MYLPAAFADHDPARCRALIEACPLATLVVNGIDGAAPEAQPVPLLFLPADANGPDRLLGHVARANPLAGAGPGTPALAVFHGPEHPISPAWYASKATDPRVVPTWNYATVHARGRLTVFGDDTRARDALRRLTEAVEPRLGSAWRITDAPADHVARLCAAVVAIELTVDRLHGKWKLSQNRSDADRASVAAALDARAAGAAPDRAAHATGMAACVREPRRVVGF